MAALGEDDFDSSDDETLLQAYEDFEQKKKDKGRSTFSGLQDVPGLGSIEDADEKFSSIEEWMYEDNNKILTFNVRSARSRYVNASDLQMQEWCEQQMIYNISSKMGMPPQMISEEGELVKIKDIQLTTPAMKAGTEVHKKKALLIPAFLELAKPKSFYVQIDVNTQADSFALKLLNTIQHVKQLLNGARCVREVTVFSTPFDHGFMIMGIVDELRMNEDGQLELVEVKTRHNRHTQPSKAQIRTHNLQIMVYKQIIDDLVTGVVDGKLVLEKMRLDPEHVLDEKVLEHARALDVTGFTLGGVMNAMLEQFQFLPRVGSLVVEYYPSGDDSAHKELLSSRRVDFDEAWLKHRLDTHFGFWHDKRKVTGVDIEDIGLKCNRCQFIDACHWRKHKNDEVLKKRNQKVKKRNKKGKKRNQNGKK